MGHFKAIPRTVGPYQDRSFATQRPQDRSSKNPRTMDRLSGTFISGSGPVGQGSVEKRAGNSNFEGGTTIEVAVLVRMLAVSGDQLLPGVARM